MNKLLWIGIVAVCGLAAVQEPKPLPRRPAQEPEKVKAAAEAKAPIPGTPVRDPIEGVYRVTGRMLDGTPVEGDSRGYVAITGRHMLLVLAGPGSDPGYPLLRAGVRTWKRQDAGVRSVIELGFFTDEEGEVHIEAPGAREIRRIDLLRGRLRIWQDQRSYLEFERLE